jgi:hypothetical protein
MLIPSWRPKRRQVYYTEQPDFVPDWVYTEAVTAKRFYNENWEFWVYLEATQANVSQAKAEDACIRGLKTALDRTDFVFGPQVGKWYREFLDMDDILNKVVHPIYTEMHLEGV